MGEVNGGSLSKQVFGMGLFLLIIAGIPASCEAYARKTQRETEAVCRRAIERNYNVPADKAAEQIKAQREWEGR